MTPPTVTAPLWLENIVKWGKDCSDTDQVLTTAFEAEDYLECIKDLWKRGVDPLSYINNLGNILDSLPVDSSSRRRCLRALRKTCGIYGILPDSYMIADSFVKPDRPYTSGGFSSVWKVTGKSNSEFAVKVLFVSNQNVKEVEKRYCKEVIIFRQLNHPNVLRIEGAARSVFNTSDYCMVSQWMNNEDILKYVTQHPRTNRLELLVGVTRGLNYLHNNEVVHGDLKSPNILVDMGGSPHISDYGLSSITKGEYSVNASTPNNGSTVRYCAPEFLDADRAKRQKPTTKADIYSLSMVIVELVTGKVPFPESNDFKIHSIVSKGKRPPRPDRFEAPGISKAVWDVAEKCWHSKAERRPEANEVLQGLEKIADPAEDAGQPSAVQRLLSALRR